MSNAATLKIRTPEGVVFSQQLAGPMTRFLAWTIDLLVLIGFLIALNLALTVFSILSIELAQAAGMLMFFGFSIGYSIFTEWRWRGQTIGKRCLRIRVVDVHGLRLKFGQIVIRNLVRPLDMLPGPYLIGGLACLLSSRCQRLGDLAANTVVVRVPIFSEPNLEQLMAGKYNSLRAYPHLEARLRQRISSDEASIALRAIVRRDLLEDRARVVVFEELAAHFKSKVSFPADAVEGISDEQYVRNVLDCIFRPGRKAPTVSALKPDAPLTETPPGTPPLVTTNPSS